MAPVMRSAKAAALVLASLAAATVLARPGAAFKVAPGETCKCAIVSKAPPSCTTGVRALAGGRFECTRSANGAGCSPAWECVTSGATHMCQAFSVDAPYTCTGPVSGGSCPCEAGTVKGVNLRVMQSTPGGVQTPTPRTGGGKPWTPSGPAPPPQKPVCRSRHVGVQVNGKKLACVSSMNIGKRSASAAYQFKNWQQNGWPTYKDDFINLNFLRDAASRMYFCVTYGSHTSKTSTQTWRYANASIVTTGANRFYAADDPAAKGQYDSYAMKKLSGSRTRLVARHHWADTKTDGYCVAVGTKGVVARFTGLSLIRGVAAGNAGLAGPTKYGKVGAKWAVRMLAKEAPTKVLKYDSAGRVLPPAEQDAAWRKSGRYAKRPDAAMLVKLTPRCDCKNW